MSNIDETTALIKKRRQELNLTYEKLGEMCGVGASTVRKWEVGMISNMRRDNIVKLSKALGLSPLDFLDIDFNDEIKENTSNNSIQSQHLTVYGKICAGEGKEVFEDPIDEITNPYHRIKGELFALQVDGDSMNNVVNHKDYAIIQKKEEVLNGEIAVVLINHELGMLKRFYRIDDMVILRPDSTNQEHKPLTFIGEEINSLKILGRFIGSVRPMEKLL